MSETIMSVDLEYDWGTKRTRNLETTMPRLLEFFDDKKIKATFFVLGEIAEMDRFESLLNDIGKKHEIGSHGYSHKLLKDISDEDVNNEIKKSRKALERLGFKPKGFRCPEFLFPKNIGSLLKKNKFEYDSSLVCAWFPGRYNNLFHSQDPYNASGKDLAKKGNDIIELPVSNFTIKKWPFGLPFIRLFYPLSIWGLKPRNVFYMHPCEFLEEKPEGYSFMVRKIYSRNRGRKAWEVFERVVSRMEDFDVKFVSCKDFIKKRNIV